MDDTRQRQLERENRRLRTQLRRLRTRARRVREQGQGEARAGALAALLEQSHRIVGERTMQGLLHAALTAARELTGCQQAFTGRLVGNRVEIGLSSCTADAQTCFDGSLTQIEPGGAYERIITGKRALRLTAAEVGRQPRAWGPPDDHLQPRALLGAPLSDATGGVSGLIVLSDKPEGDFTAQDEALLTQVAALTSLGLQHVEARQEVEHRAREIEGVFAALTDVVIVYGHDGRVQRTTPRAPALLGFDPVGMDRLEALHRLDTRYPDGRAVEARRLPSSRALSGETVTGEVVTVALAGGLRRTVEESASPLYVAGRMGGAVAVWHDITEREELLEHLAGEHRLLNTILRQIPAAIIVAEAPSGRTLLTNERLTEYLGEPFEAQAIADYARYRGATARRANDRAGTVAPRAGHQRWREHDQ